MSGRLGEPGRTPPSKLIGGYKITSAPVDVDPLTASELATILRNPRVYAPVEMESDCIFFPGVALHFTGDADVTEIMICFMCDQLMVITNGRRVWLDNSSGVDLKMVQLVKSLFPDDSEIQQIGHEY